MLSCRWIIISLLTWSDWKFFVTDVCCFLRMPISLLSFFNSFGGCVKVLCPAYNFFLSIGELFFFLFSLLVLDGLHWFLFLYFCWSTDIVSIAYQHCCWLFMLCLLQYWQHQVCLLVWKGFAGIILLPCRFHFPGYLILASLTFYFLS